MLTEFPQVFQLSLPEKLRLVEELWENISSTPKELPVPESHIQELERRKEAFLKNPEAGMTWEEAMQRIRNRHG